MTSTGRTTWRSWPGVDSQEAGGRDDPPASWMRADLVSARRADLRAGARLTAFLAVARRLATAASWRLLGRAPLGHTLGGTPSWPPRAAWPPSAWPGALFLVDAPSWPCARLAGGPLLARRTPFGHSLLRRRTPLGRRPSWPRHALLGRRPLGRSPLLCPQRFLAVARLAGAFLAERPTLLRDSLLRWGPFLGRFSGRSPSLRGYCHRCTSLGALSLNRGEACVTSRPNCPRRAHCRTVVCDGRHARGEVSDITPLTPTRPQTPSREGISQ